MSDRSEKARCRRPRSAPHGGYSGKRGASVSIGCQRQSFPRGGSLGAQERAVAGGRCSSVSTLLSAKNGASDSSSRVWGDYLAAFPAGPGRRNPARATGTHKTRRRPTPSRNPFREAESAKAAATMRRGGMAAFPAGPGRRNRESRRYNQKKRRRYAAPLQAVRAGLTMSGSLAIHLAAFVQRISRERWYLLQATGQECARGSFPPRREPRAQERGGLRRREKLRGVPVSRNSAHG